MDFFVLKVDVMFFLVGFYAFDAY